MREDDLGSAKAIKSANVARILAVLQEIASGTKQRVGGHLSLVRSDDKPAKVISSTSDNIEQILAALTKNFNK